MSRDIKGTSLTQLNDGLERAVDRAKRQLRNDIANAEANAVSRAINVSDRRIREAQQQMNDRLRQASDNLGRRIENAQRNLGARIDEQARRTAREMQELDRRHTAALRNLSDSMYNAISAQGRRITEEVERLDNNIGVLSKGLDNMGRQMRSLADEVDSRFARQQQEISAIQKDLRSLFEQRAEDENTKLLAAGAALAVLESIRERTDLERFAPKHMLDSLRLKEERLRNIAGNPAGCSVTDANNLMDEAIVAENEAMRRQAEWEPLHQAALASAMAILGMLEKSENLKVPSLYEEGAEEELQADYWTHGRYGRLRGEMEALKKDIENMPADTERLKAIQAELEAKKHEAERLIIEAAELGTLSEQRIIISNDILNVMTEQGWELQEDPDFLGGETESDWREGTFAMLRKPGTGEELSILVLPEEKGGKVGNQLIFHRNDDRIESGKAFHSRMSEIRREIEKSGYKLGDLFEPKAGGDGKVERLRNAGSMKSKGAAEELKKRLARG